MSLSATTALRPGYDQYRPMTGARADRAAAFARQLLADCRPLIARDPGEWRVLDVGCGYGHRACALSRHCQSVLGIDVCTEFLAHAESMKVAESDRVEFRRLDVVDSTADGEFDLVILDNSLEHMPDQSAAIARVCRAVRPGGAVYIVVPNKLWPMEVHYHLPFLSYLPLRWANRYLRLSGRGADYTDASYAPTYWGLLRLFRRHPEFEVSFVVPSDLSGAAFGQRWHYRLGAAALRRCEPLWILSKVFVLIARRVR